MRTGALAINATNISTYTPIGVPMDSVFFQDWTPCGILKLEYIPHFGDINSPTHPLNVVARDLYDFVNARNSRSSSYDPADLMLYVIGVANAWVYHSWVRRVVGMYNTYSMLNRYWWDPVMATMGVEPISGSATITDWVDLANYIAMTLNTLAVPDDIKYFERAQMLTSTVYADSLSQKCSLYYYSPAQLLKYGYDSEGKGQVVSYQPVWEHYGVSNRGLTPAKVKADFDTFVSSLLNDTDISFMKADIRKAFGEEHCYHLDQIDRSFEHSYYYDGFVNLQTRNATIFDCLDGFPYSVTQNMSTNSLTSPRALDWVMAHQDAQRKPGYAYFTNTYTVGSSHLFDFPVDEVSNDLWTEATKLHAYVGHGSRFKATTEVIIRDTMYVFDNNTIAPYQDNINLHVISGTVDPESVSDMLTRIELASKFAASPLQWAFVTPQELINAPVSEVYLIEDLTNYTTVDIGALDKIHDSSQISIFTWHDMA
jgi:hypothetical protein